MPIDRGFLQQMCSMTGYEPITTFWDDFSIADAFGKNAVEDTYDRAFREWKSNYKYLTELVMIINIYRIAKVFFHLCSHPLPILFPKTEPYLTARLSKNKFLNFSDQITRQNIFHPKSTFELNHNKKKKKEVFI